jgi:hypothetical protein
MTGTARRALLALVAVSAGCESDPCCFREGERLRVSVLERLHAFRGTCVPLDVGDSFTLEIGEIHDACWNHEPDEVACKRAPLRGVPRFARVAVSECAAPAEGAPLELRCTGEPAPECTPTMDLALSPILRRDLTRVERGHLVVRWNLREGALDDAGRVAPCPVACEEGFRVRIELVDR